MNERDRNEGLRISEPCPKKWAELTGEGSKRWCESCTLHVIDGSALTKREAEQQAARTDERVCMRLVVDDDGRPVHAKERTRSGVGWRGVVAATAAFLAACVGDKSAKKEPEEQKTDGQNVETDGSTIDTRPVEILGEVCFEPPTECGGDETTPEPREIVGRVAPRHLVEGHVVECEEGPTQDSAPGTSSDD